jgi:aminoglycoside phosphotransferase (APT) family kinase protein
MPAAEVAISTFLLRRLLVEQHPDLARLRLVRLAEGWDNVVIRIGKDLLARLPRRALGAKLIEHEQRWLPLLAPRLPLPVPAPIRIGEPGPGYPWRWSITRFLPGRPLHDFRLPPGAAAALGGFFRTLHAEPLAADAPANPFRGGPLAHHAGSFWDRLRRVRGQIVAWMSDGAERAWTDGLAAASDAAPVWLHGDPHPLNVLLHKRAVSGVIDWGDICAGDPAADLGGFWGLTPMPDDRDVAFAAYGAVSPATMARARGWAAYYGVTMLDAGLINSPQHAAIGAAILANLAAL